VKLEVREPRRQKEHSAAKPQPKERGVYAASTLEVPEPEKWKCSLEVLDVEAA